MTRAFQQADRFISELESRKLRPAYVLVGDEAFSVSAIATLSSNIWSRLTHAISVSMSWT